MYGAKSIDHVLHFRILVNFNQSISTSELYCKSLYMQNLGYFNIRVLDVLKHLL